MPRPSRVALANLAFWSGASSCAWILASARWVGSWPDAAGIPDRFLGAALVLGLAVGAALGARTGPLVLAARFGRRQIALASLAAGVTATLPWLGAGGPLLLLVAAFAAGAAIQGLYVHTASLLLGAALVGVPLGGPGWPDLGIARTSWIAIAGMAATGALGLALGGGEPSRRSEGFPTAAPFWLAAAGLLLGAWVAIASRLLAPYVGPAPYARQIFAGTLLLGLAGGTILAGVRDRKSPLLLVAAASGLASMAVYGQLEWLVPGAARRLGGIATWPRAAGLVAGETALVLLPAVTALGAAVGPSVRANARGMAWIALGVAAGLFAAPSMVAGLGLPAAVAAWITAGLLVASGAFAADLAGRGRLLAIGACSLLLLPTAWLAARTSPHYPFDVRYGPLLHFAETPEGAVLVTDDPEQGRILRFSDGRSPGGVGTDPEDRANAQLPMMLHPSVNRVLQIGFGVGNAASSMLAWPIEQLDVVDPSGAAAKVAPLFDFSNLDVVSDERLVLHTSDPWSFLRRAARSWDVIRLSSDRLEAGDEDLPTLERLQLARNRLAPGGLVSIRLNVGRASVDEIRSVLATVDAVFDHVSVWEGPFGYNWVVIGSDVTRLPDPERLRRLVDDPDVEAEIVSLGLDDPAVLDSYFVRGPAGVRDLAASASLVTTDRAIVDRRAARSPDTFFGLGAAAADTPLGDLTAPDGRENVGLARLFEKLNETRALKRPPPTR